MPVSVSTAWTASVCLSWRTIHITYTRKGVLPYLGVFYVISTNIYMVVGELVSCVISETNIKKRPNTRVKHICLLNGTYVKSYEMFNFTYSCETINRKVNCGLNPNREAYV